VKRLSRLRETLLTIGELRLDYEGWLVWVGEKGARRKLLFSNRTTFPPASALTFAVLLVSAFGSHPCRLSSQVVVVVDVLEETLSRGNATRFEIEFNNERRGWPRPKIPSKGESQVVLHKDSEQTRNKTNVSNENIKLCSSGSKPAWEIFEDVICDVGTFSSSCLSRLAYYMPNYGPVIDIRHQNIPASFVERTIRFPERSLRRASSCLLSSPLVTPQPLPRLHDAFCPSSAARVYRGLLRQRQKRRRHRRCHRQ
jgi:hypothetical protein